MSLSPVGDDGDRYRYAALYGCVVLYALEFGH